MGNALLSPSDVRYGPLQVHNQQTVLQCQDFYARTAGSCRGKKPLFAMTEEKYTTAVHSSRP